MTIGEKIRCIRKEKGLTQKELSRRSGIAEITIRQYEANKYNPKPDAVMKLCAGLNCTINDLIDDENQKYYRMFDNISITFSSKMPDSREEKKRNELIKTFNELSSHGKEEAPHLLNAFSSLNSTGQNEAVKRVKELSKIEGYRKGDSEYDPDPPQY